MQDNQQHWLSIDELCHNQKIRCLTIKKDRILRALKESKYLQLSSDQERVRRPDFTLPKLKPNRDLRRTVFLYGIPYNKTEQDIRKILSLHGHIKRIHFQPDHDIDPDDPNSSHPDSNIDDEAPNKAVAQLIMKKKFLFPSRYSHSDHDTDNESNRGGFRNDGNITPKSLDGNQSDNSSKRDRMMSDLYAHPVRNPNGDAQDFSHLKTCFVVFESQSQATKCVKARVRAVDGMRCIHKYDYNKVAKKFRTAQMKGEKLSFSPPPPNYQSPRISSQGERGGYHNNHHRGKSPGAQSDRYGGNNSYGNNRRYNRSFGPNGRGDNNYNNNDNHNRRGDNRGYQSYRDRSHSQSSQGSNHGDRGDRNNNNNNNRYDNDRNNNNNYGRQGRYYQRNNNNNQNRSQTPNYHKSSNYGNNNNGGGPGYNILGRNKQRGDDDKENQNSMRSSGHRLGRRADRNSHDNSNDKPNDVRSYHDRRNKYGNNNNNNQSQSGYNNNRGNNNRHGASTSPHRSSHSAAHSVGNQSNTSDQSNMNKPILYSMNKNNGNNGNNNNNGNNDGNNVNAPQQDVRKVQNNNNNNNNNQQTQQQQQNIANQPTYARKKQPVRAATPNMNSNGSIVSPPQLHSFVGNEISPSPDLKKPQNVNNNNNNNQQQQTGTKTPAKMIRSVSANTAPISNNNQQQQPSQQRASTPKSSQQSRSTAAPQLYHPIGTNALPTRQDAQALQAAGYNHELYYLPIDDPNIVGIMDDIYQDPLVAYDVYFGVDQSGKSTSTQAAAQQLQQQQQRVQQQQHQQQPQQQQQQAPQQQVHQRHSQPQHTAYSSHYNQQNVQQQQQQNYGNYQQQQQQYSQTPTHHQQQQQQYHPSYNMNQQQVPSTNLQHSSSLQHSSYSAHSQYQQQQSNGPRSAPYGPVNKQSQTSSSSSGRQYRAEQWQLDKLEQFKQQKQQQIIAQKQAQQQQVQQPQQQGGGKTTALSVLSSSN